jgi:hypothetical protein
VETIVNGKSAEIIRVPNTLKAKLGGRFSIDPNAIARAEAALKGLSDQFGDWMQDELNKLDASRAGVTGGQLTADTANALYTRAHDLKGLGTTYGFPLVSRLGASMCRLLDEPSTRASAPLFLVDAHINAIKAAVRDEVRDCDHPVGRTLVAELEGRVDAYLKG